MKLSSFLFNLTMPRRIMKINPCKSIPKYRILNTDIFTIIKLDYRDASFVTKLLN